MGKDKIMWSNTFILWLNIAKKKLWNLYRMPRMNWNNWLEFFLGRSVLEDKCKKDRFICLLRALSIFFFTTYDNVLDFLQIEINVAVNPICYHFVLKTIPGYEYQTYVNLLHSRTQQNTAKHSKAQQSTDLLATNFVSRLFSVSWM